MIEVLISAADYATMPDGYTVQDYQAFKLREAGVPLVNGEKFWTVERGELWRTDHLNGDTTFRWREQ